MLLEAVCSGDVGSEAESPVCSSCSGSEEDNRGKRLSRRAVAPARKALEKMVAARYVEMLRSDSGEEGAIVGCRYRKVPPVPQHSPESIVNEGRQRRRYLQKQERVDRALVPPE